eukprot:COSAG06_NODE_3071_length_5894_cov_6.093701_7_plen_59_part_00
MGSQGGVGIVLHGGAGRVEQSYLDYAPLVIREKGSIAVTMVEVRACSCMPACLPACLL